MASAALCRLMFLYSLPTTRGRVSIEDRNHTRRFEVQIGGKSVQGDRLDVFLEVIGINLSFIEMKQHEDEKAPS